MTSRGCTSRLTRRVTQVRRPSWTVILRTPALRQRAFQERLKLRGSIGVPYLVLNTHLPPCHIAPAASRTDACWVRRCRNAVVQRSTSGSTTSLEVTVEHDTRFRSWSVRVRRRQSRPAGSPSQYSSPDHCLPHTARDQPTGRPVPQLPHSGRSGRRDTPAVQYRASTCLERPASPALICCVRCTARGGPRAVNPVPT